MKNYKRIFTIVVDSLGVGADDLPGYDTGANTLAHIADHMPNFKIPTLQKLGMANITPLASVEANASPKAVYTKMKEASVGKDTMTGHWEMMGLEIKTPFKTFTETGFPKELIDELEKRTGRKIVGNKSASGTEILDEFGEDEINNGVLIVYTSADSVLQICGNEETMGVETLYKYCEIARELTMRPEWMVGRVIARPYTGSKKGEFVRTANRHDYALKPYGPTALDALKDGGYDVISVGKIKDIFDGEGISEAYKSKSSVHGMEQTIDLLQKDFTGLCFTNLVDFDALWGHRRNPVGYGEELERFDEKLNVFIEQMQDDDLVIITADHGNDPTYEGSDHTKETVPFIAYSKKMVAGKHITEFDTFANIGATICDNFEVAMPEGTIGESVLDTLVEQLEK
ncbi:phosphopentomutase [Breznakia blatticola]|uniref:Phosphopentomutase n=1 Tax=Breznakia blatticola TaxID=1754012 RepID=A0A4R8A560_9FIRM|nr:phosphopentomutase [Breznakia blatticola]TDW25774.1 phosphopentomutase [Breznakia blatticola]